MSPPKKVTKACRPPTKILRTGLRSAQREESINTLLGGKGGDILFPQFPLLSNHFLFYEILFLCSLSQLFVASSGLLALLAPVSNPMGPTSGSNKGSVQGLRQGRRLASYLIIIISTSHAAVWGTTAAFFPTCNETLSGVAAIGSRWYVLHASGGRVKLRE